MGNYNKVIIQPDSIWQKSFAETTYQLDITKRDNIRPYTFGMGKQAEIEAGRKCPVQRSYRRIAGLKIQSRKSYRQEEIKRIFRRSLESRTKREDV